MPTNRYYLYEDEEVKYGYKSIPAWVDRNLASYGNCFVSKSLMTEIMEDLKAYFGKTKYEIERKFEGKKTLGYIITVKKVRA